jgi:transposase InsO family protein
MAEVGADLFEAGKQHFLIVVDRYSGFPLVAKLTLQSSESIIGHIKKMFYLLGRLGEIKCDNGPCFRTEFKNWAKDRDIIVNNSAPNKPTSNGLAERAVGIVKHMLLKHHLNYEAFMHALMEFRVSLCDISKILISSNNGIINYRYRSIDSCLTDILIFCPSVRDGILGR